MQINEINRPHCDECGTYYQGNSSGRAYVFLHSIVRLCELCDLKFVALLMRVEKKKLEESKIDIQ